MKIPIKFEKFSSSSGEVEKEIYIDINKPSCLNLIAKSNKCQMTIEIYHKK